MIIHTESGSVYELQGKRIRRLNDVQGTSERAGFDGQWRDLIVAPVVKVGCPIFLYWTNDIQPPAEDGAIPATVTSLVAQVVA